MTVNQHVIAMQGPVDAQFWTSFTHILMLRDPLSRYLSLIGMESLAAEPKFLKEVRKWDGDKPLAIGQVRRHVLWQNYDNCLTRHFVLDGGWQANIGDAEGTAAKATLGKFDLILDFDGLSLESADLLLLVLGIRSDLEDVFSQYLLRHKEHNQTTASAVKEVARKNFFDQNRYDAAVHADARARIKAHWARLTRFH